MRSRRAAREAALRVLYQVEVGRSNAEQAFEPEELEPEQEHYARRVVAGVRENRANIDQNLAGYVREYDYSRLAAIDRNILRIGAYELLFVPEMPPGVTINEAIEIAKQYSTAESGRFINGVLGRMLKDSQKANWDPAKAPKEFQEEIVRQPEPQIEEEVVTDDSQEAERARRFGQWTVKEDERVDS